MIEWTPRSTREKKDGFSRREREIMDALDRLGQATAAQILEQIADPPSYTASGSDISVPPFDAVWIARCGNDLMLRRPQRRTLPTRGNGL